MLCPVCGVAQTPNGGLFYLSVTGILGGLPHDLSTNLFTFFTYCEYNLTLTMHNKINCMHLIFCANYLRVFPRVLTGLLLWPDMDEGDLMDEDYDSESDI